MIEFPGTIVPNSATFMLIDQGFVQEGAGGLGDRIDRPGNHFACEIDFPPMVAEVARVFEARVTRAIRHGLRVAIPLLTRNQGIPGLPVVDGDEPSGTTLPLRGLIPGYVVKEGYWLTIVEAASGQRFAHKAAALGQVASDGTVAIEVEPPLRAPFADGDVVLLARPTIEGVLKTPPSWTLAIDQLVRNGARLTIEEVS